MVHLERTTARLGVFALGLWGAALSSCGSSSATHVAGAGGQTVSGGSSGLGTGGGPGGSTPDSPDPPGSEVTVTLPASRAAELQAINSQLAATRALDTDQLLQNHALPFVTQLGYDPSSATNLPTIQGSTVALDASERAVLAARGFVLSDRQVYPGFLYGYSTIYGQDLPVFISADSLLFALHKSYDEILKSLELGSLRGELRAMLAGMRAQLASGAATSLGARAEKDADLYLAVALGLLDGAAAPPVAGASATDVADLVAKATAAERTQVIALFGRRREIDFSQFTPRGHYQGVLQLERYFRAMIWLGRMDLPLADFQPPSDKGVFYRQAFDAAVALMTLLDAPARAHWKHVDDTIRTFVGEPDAMEPPDFAGLMRDLDVTDLAGFAPLSDQRIAQGLIDGGYGRQRIASQLLVGAAPGSDTSIPLASTFLLLGQRYVVDSHVFSNLVYDRVNHNTAHLRMLPDPLDVAYAALGNDATAPLLRDQLQMFAYAPDLERTRQLVEAHGDSFWSANLYNLWLSALRALSPTAASLTAATAIAIPAVFRSEGWARRTLNTQLASWAELRHDTILYAKQSYTSGVICEFPDAFVEPSPAFFGRLGDYARKGAALVATLDFGADPGLGADVGAYFAHLGDVAGILGATAEAQQTGAAIAPAYLAFINQAVRMGGPGVCGSPPMFDGWYAGLFFHRAGVALVSETFDPTIADVHTEWTDEAGAVVGRVLHVGTGYARLMVLTVETCGGPRAYAGLASSYHELVTQNFKRLTDSEWKDQYQSQRPASVSWLNGVLSGR